MTVVNYLNGGTGRGQAHGMKLETLAKLDTVRPIPGSGTR
jgi:hypothetical protein